MKTEKLAPRPLRWWRLLKIHLKQITEELDTEEHDYKRGQLMSELFGLAKIVVAEFPDDDTADFLETTHNHRLSKDVRCITVLTTYTVQAKQVLEEHLPSDYTVLEGTNNRYRLLETGDMTHEFQKQFGDAGRRSAMRFDENNNHIPNDVLEWMVASLRNIHATIGSPVVI